MNWITGSFIYFILWFMVLFVALPIGVRIPEESEPGHADSAPSNPMIGRKMLIAAVIAAVLWAALYWLLQSGLVSFRQD